ncbi:uncharacterized protein [Malus domestica]|uniref:uncharacterized protein n=1 Tax=Malus domestica TaxID=3750 RepID=UPI0039754E5A
MANRKAKNAIVSAILSNQFAHILRCLPKRFQAKKAVIQEFQDLNEIKLGKLVGKLITYDLELEMDESDSKKIKEVAFQSVEKCEFGKSSNNREKKSTGVKHKRFTRKRDKGVLKVPGPYFTCGGSGHRAADYGNIKLLGQKNKKAMMVTWSDKNDQGSVHSDELSDNEEKIVAFVAPIEEVSLSDDDSVLNDNEEMSYDELCIKYDSLFDETCTTKVERIELTKKVVVLQKENMSLCLVRIELDEKIGYLEAYVEELNEKAFNCNEKVEKDDVITTLEAQVQKLLESQENLMNQIHALKANNVMYHEVNRKQLLELNEANDKSSSSGNIKQSPKWVQKALNMCLVVLNALSITKPNVWNLDSGCTCHMTRDKEAFSSLTPFICGGVVFGGGYKSQITRKCDIKIPGLPKLENVSYVDGLKSNLISISQLCDDVVDEVCFSKRGCWTVDEHGKNLHVLPRSGDNCYILDVSKVAEYSKCHKAIDETSILWHKRLGHVNFKYLKKLSKHEVVKGLPSIFVSDSYVCGSCM